MSWDRDAVNDLLRTAGWRTGTPPHDLYDLEVCEKLMGTLQRAVPYSDRRLAQSVEGAHCSSCFMAAVKPRSCCTGH